MKKFKKVILVAFGLSALALAACSTADTSDTTTTPAVYGTSAPVSSEPTTEVVSQNAVNATTQELTSFDAMSRVYFDFAKADLKDDAKQTLDQVVSWLKDNNNEHIRVEGYTDPRGTVNYNKGLGARRAKAIVDYLVANGIDVARVHSVSYGETVPAGSNLCTDNTEDCYAKRRQGHIVVVANTQQLHGAAHAAKQADATVTSKTPATSSSDAGSSTSTSDDEAANNVTTKTTAVAGSDDSAN